MEKLTIHSARKAQTIIGNVGIILKLKICSIRLIKLKIYFVHEMFT